MVTALIIVDPQNDFCEGGPLAVQDSNQIFSKIEQLRRKGNGFDQVFVTLDWHPQNHTSFAKNHNQAPFSKKIINGSQEVLWPVHCVQNSHGAQPSKLLKLWDNQIYVKKGIQQDQEQYSGFGTPKYPTELAQKLIQLNVDQIVVVGLALDFCVGSTALDARKAGFNVKVIKECTKPVSQQIGQQMVKKMKAEGIEYQGLNQFMRCQ